MNNLTNEEKDILIEKIVNFQLKLEEYKNNFDNKLNNIFLLINDYLLENCSHNKVQDLIDINPEKSQSIIYCSKCFTTFSSLR
jgi:hypothetical protein